jgi:hypothetical protein
MSRTHLGRSEWIFRQSHADMLDDAVESVRFTTLEIQRTRVFFDETRMVTLHRQIPHDLLWTGVALAAAGGLISTALMFEAPAVAVVAALLLFAPGAVIAVMALVRRSLVLTVQGPRTQARVVAMLSQHRLADAHRDILRRVAAAQAASAPGRAPAPS